MVRLGQGVVIFSSLLGAASGCAPEKPHAHWPTFAEHDAMLGRRVPPAASGLGRSPPPTGISQQRASAVTPPPPRASPLNEPVRVRPPAAPSASNGAVYEAIGLATWFGYELQGRPTAYGERYDIASMSAAHLTLPPHSLVEIANLENGRSALVRINDRALPISGHVIEVSQAAAVALGFRERGTARVRVRHVGRMAPGEPPVRFDAPRGGNASILR